MGVDSDVLDYGAGLGLGSDAMSNVLGFDVDSFEPNSERWKGNKDVTFRSSNDINKKYKSIVSLNVLNVVEKDIRDSIVKDIYNNLKDGGTAVISARKWSGDVNQAKNAVDGGEKNSLYITRTQGGKEVKVFQKGFDGNELVDYIKDLLGDNVTVEKNNSFGAAGVVIKKTGNIKSKAQIPTDSVEATTEALKERLNPDYKNTIVEKLSKFDKQIENSKFPSALEVAEHVLPRNIFNKYKALYELAARNNLNVSNEKLPYGMTASWAFGNIQLNKDVAKYYIEDYNEFAETLNHEIIHGLISNGIKDNYALFNDLQGVMNEVINRFDSATEGVKEIISYIQDTRSEYKSKDIYGATDEEFSSDNYREVGDLEELITYAFTNKEFADFLDSIPASKKINVKGDSIFQQLKNIIRGFISKITKSPTALDEINFVIDKYFDTSWNEKQIAERNEQYEWGLKFKANETIFDKYKNDPEVISKAYHKGDNPKLNKAVDELLSVSDIPTTIKSKAQKAQDARIKEFIDVQRKAGQSDKDIKAGLELVADKVGLTPEDINNLMGVESDEAKPKKGYTPKKKKVEPAQEPEVKEQKERAFATEAERRTGDKTTEIPDSLKFYTPTSEEEQTKIAQDFIKEVGVDEAITYFTIPSKRIEINPQNLPVLASELLDILYAKQASASETEAKQIADNVHDILEATVVAAGNAATLLSMMRKFYNSNPYNFLAQVTRLLELNNKPIADKIGTAIININNINKAVAGEVANNVVKEIVSTRAASAKEKFERSKANLKALWKKSFNIGIASNQYEAAKNDIQFVKALAVMAKDFVVYQSVEFSEFIKEVASQIGLQESDIDQDHLRKIFEKAKSEKIQEGIKVSLKELELKLKDLIESHYSSPNSIADDLVNKLKDQFGLSDTDAKKVEEAIRQEIKVLTAQEKIKALKAEGIKDKKYIDEILALSEQGLLNVNSIIEKLGAKLGIQKLTKEETDKLVELAKQIKEAKEDRIKARNVQKFEDYKFVLSKKFNLSDFLVSNYLTNIFGSLRSNLANIAGNVSETNLLVSEIVTNALLKGNPKDALLGIEALIRGTVRGFDFTKEVLTTGVSSYKELGDIRARGMWELIMDRKVDLTKTERVLQYLLSIPYLGEAALTERRFWNRALLSMDSLSGTTNAELGALWAATKEADNRKLKGQARANFIAELMAATPELKAEAQMYAAQLGYKPGTSESKRAVTNYLVSKRPAPIKKIASEYSARATLTQQPSPNTLTGMIATAMNNAIGKNQKLKFIFPVVNTFANLIVKNIERSPFEFLSLGLDVLRAQSENKTIGRDVLTQEEVARRIKTATVWTAIAVLLFMAAGGMGDDDEEGLEIYGSGTGNAALDKQRRSLGWKPNTIRFGKDGGYFNFEYLPFGFMLSMVGNMRDYFKYKDESGLAIRKAQSKRLFNKTYDSLTSAEKAKLEAELMSGKYNLPDVENKELGNLVWNIFKTPGTYTLQLFKSLGDLIGVMGDKSKWENVASFLGNIGRGVAAPRYGGEIRDITDNKLYDTKEFRNMLAANVPGVTLGNVRLDAFGREIDKYKSQSFWSGVKYVFTSRFYNPPTVTPIDQFLWENRIVVNMPDNPPSLAYNDDVFRAYLVKRGDILLNKIWNAMKEKKFQKIDNSGKVVKFTPQQNLEVINKYVSQSNEEAKKFIDELLKKAKKLY
jgi:hypothetical protein